MSRYAVIAGNRWLSEVVDTIERMFETETMAPPSSGAATAALRVDDELPAAPGEVVRELQARIRRMQRNKLDSK